jgi:hypothetical protein
VPNLRLPETLAKNTHAKNTMIDFKIYRESTQVKSHQLNKENIFKNPQKKVPAALCVELGCTLYRSKSDMHSTTPT